MTQQALATTAGVHIGTVRKIERGARGASDDMVDTLADALGIDPTRLVGSTPATTERVAAATSALSRVLATYEQPPDGPVRALPELRRAVSDAEAWRLGAQYVRIARHLPDVLAELLRAVRTAPVGHQADIAALVTSAARAADALAYKSGAMDLSARLIDVMRWAAPQANDPVVVASAAYVRTEVYFAARAHSAGLRALEEAIDALPHGQADIAVLAARGYLHMRAAVIAGRAGRADDAGAHLAVARDLAQAVPEGVYTGTAFGPDSVRVHEVSIAVSLGRDTVGQALAVAREWTPPTTLPAERRSGFFIELARAQLWSGAPGAAFESLTTARQIAPQHTRTHPWVREDAATLRRLRRADLDALSRFAEWCHAGE